MKLLADENIPRKTVEDLSAKGFDIIPVTVFGRGLPDVEVLRAAKREGRILVTFDKDFGELVYRSSHETLGIILLRIQPVESSGVAAAIEKAVSTVQHPEHKMIIVSDTRIRVVPINRRKKGDPKEL